MRDLGGTMAAAVPAAVQLLLSPQQLVQLLAPLLLSWMWGVLQTRDTGRWTLHCSTVAAV